MRSRRPQLIIQKGRYNEFLVNLGVDISGDTFTSEIRAEQDSVSDVLASFHCDTTENLNVLKLSLEVNDISEIEQTNGWMDIKRVSGEKPLPVFDRPLEVIFRDTVTE